MTHQFLLPSSPAIRRQDRFGLVDSDEYELPFWDILTAILRSELAPVVDISSLIEVMETIAVTLRGTHSDVDYGLLREFMTTYLAQRGSGQFFEKTWPFLVNLALEMPTLFVDGSLPSMSVPQGASVAEAMFSRKQIACLVIHQFLCSLPPHPWSTESFVDLRPWYSVSSTVHRGAVNAYLTALFAYFERLQSTNETQQSPLDFSVEEWPIVFTMRVITDRTAEAILKNEANDALLNLTRIEPIYLAQSETTPAFLGLPDGACVISANKCVGYGPSGTQEELQVGISPEVYPIVLLAPPLSDNQVLICRGAEAMVSIKGYGRDARLDEILNPRRNAPDDSSLEWRRRTMLFMDALELDVLPVVDESLISDIHPPFRLIRDMVLKAYNGFCGGNEMYSHIVTGLWGCRTFGGNRYIKCILQWCAAALARIPSFRFVFAGMEQQEFGQEFTRFVAKVEAGPVTVKQMFDLLVRLKADIHQVGPTGIFNFILDNLS